MGVLKSLHLKQLAIRHLKIFLLYFAATITVLHSLFPHEHHVETNDVCTAEDQKESDGIFDYLKLVFHVDLGEGHMENFNQGKSLDVDFDGNSITIDANPLHSVYTWKNNQEAISENIKLEDTGPSLYPPNHFLSSIHFRGPPIII